MFIDFPIIFSKEFYGFRIYRIHNDKSLFNRINAESLGTARISWKHHPRPTSITISKQPLQVSRGNGQQKKSIEVSENEKKRKDFIRNILNLDIQLQKRGKPDFLEQQKLKKKILLR